MAPHPPQVLRKDSIPLFQMYKKKLTRSSNDTAPTNELDPYDIPGTNLQLEDKSGDKYTLPPVPIYQALSYASAEVCGKGAAQPPTPVSLIKAPDNLGGFEVYFGRKKGRRGWNPLSYDQLCQALRGAGELITLRKVYRPLHLQLIEGAVICDITVSAPYAVDAER